jgi:hypothetical protein
MRRVKQLGVDYVVMGGPPIPWQEAEVRSRIERLKSGGLSLFNMMISGFANTLYGRPGRDEEIHDICESIRAAGRAGLPVIEYKFYAHRAIEGYVRGGRPCWRGPYCVRLRTGEGPPAAGPKKVRTRSRYFGTRDRINHVHYRNVRARPL